MKNEMSLSFDIAIIGLGPAGSILARLLSKEFRIAAIDKKTNDGDGFHKPCGGLLSADAQKSLAKLNVNLPKDIMVDPQIFAVKTIDVQSKLIKHYQRFYLNIDRHKFDLWLKSLIPSNVEIYNNSTCTLIEKMPEGYKITFIQDHIKKEIIVKYIIGADGANSIVRRILYPDKKIRKYISIQQWFTENHATPFYSCIFDKENTDCCSWSISKDKYFIFGGAFPYNDSRKRFETQKEKLEEIGFMFGEPLKTEACLVLRPSKINDFCLGRDNSFLIGEAAGFISPSSLEGISSAINSGIILSQILNSRCKNPNKIYKIRTLKIRLKIFLKLLKCPFMYNPFLRELVMKSNLSTIKLIG